MPIIPNIPFTLPKLSRTWWTCFFITALAVAADSASTIYFMTRIGPEAELHPAVRLASIWFNPVIGPLLAFVGKTGAYAVVTLCKPRWTVFLCPLCTIIFLAAALYNVTSFL